MTPAWSVPEEWRCGLAAKLCCRLGHEPRAPFPAGGVDPILPGVCRVPGCGEPLEHIGVGGVLDHFAFGRRPAFGHPQLRGGGPVFLKEPGHRPDRPADLGQHGVPVPGVAGGVGQHVPQFPGAVVAQQQQPGVDGGGNGSREGARSGDQFQSFGQVVFAGGSCRARSPGPSGPPVRTGSPRWRRRRSGHRRGR